MDILAAFWRKGAYEATKARANGILKLATDDPERELEFELAYLRSLTTQECFALMFRKSRELAESLARHGHRQPAAIVKRS